MIKLILMFSVLYYEPKTFTNLKDVVEYYKPKRGFTGIVILDRKGQEVFSYNGDSYFVPASLNKILIASTFLHFLGPSYTFKTSLLRDSKSGNLYFLASGDPSLKVKDLFEIFSFIKSAGILSFDTLYLVDWAYDSVRYGMGWQFNNLAKGYMAPVSSFILENNVVKISLFKMNGLGTRVVPFPRTSFFKSFTRGGRSYKVYDMVRGDTVITIFEGDIGKQIFTTRSIITPENFFKEQVDSLLRILSIKVKDIKIITDLPALRFDTLYIYDSKPAYILLMDFMKYSLNIYGEAFLKTLGRELYGGKGSFEKGLAAVDSFLKVAELSDHFKPADGSGLSRYNLATPHGFAQLLYYHYKNMSHFPEFASLLAIANVDGTLANNYKDLRGIFRGKTGTLSGVTNLAGYIRTRKGEDYIYVVMLNNTPGSPKYFVEKVLKFIYETM
ncbi:MAG: D-alanyl-D-alanine carboxypeptidase/D-alanyl-D-alanine-endopeptidase [bacterium]|nr:D-alanyl-D-alanine carboxypeptidase/D-alanyl-D-alanine-endopeptidase [bacterium]